MCGIGEDVSDVAAVSVDVVEGGGCGCVGVGGCGGEYGGDGNVDGGDCGVGVIVCIVWWCWCCRV